MYYCENPESHSAEEKCDRTDRTRNVGKDELLRWDCAGEPKSIRDNLTGWSLNSVFDAFGLIGDVRDRKRHQSRSIYNTQLDPTSGQEFKPKSLIIKRPTAFLPPWYFWAPLYIPHLALPKPSGYQTSLIWRRHQNKPLKRLPTTSRAEIHHRNADGR